MFPYCTHFYLLVYILSILYTLNNCTQKLLFVYEHVRHGARGSPFDHSSPFIDEYGTQWEGDGTLTNVGQRQHYIIGIRNRLKYLNFLNFSYFDEREILIESTNSNRVIQSLYAELIAMYLPGTGKKFDKENEKNVAFPPNKNLLTEDVFTEIEKMNNDCIINQMSVFPVKFVAKNPLNWEENCPNSVKYNANRRPKVDKDIFIPFCEKFDKKYGEQLQKYFNEENKDFIYDLDRLISYTDGFIANIFNGKILDDFYNKTEINKDEFLEYCIELKKIYLYEITCDMNLGVLGASGYMRDILDYMNKRIEHEDEINYDYPKFVMQGGHDTSLNTFQYFIKAAFGYDVKFISFSSNVYFELYREINDNDDKKYVVKYFVDFEEIFSIDYLKFKENVEKFIWSNDKYLDFCFDKSEKDKEIDEIKKNNNNLKLVIIILSVAVFLFLVGFIICLVFLFKFKKIINNKEVGEGLIKLDQ